MGDNSLENENVFKSAAFGGFKKRDVIDYIEIVLGELAECRRQIAEKDEKISELEGKLGMDRPEPAQKFDSKPPADISAAIDCIVNYYLNADDENA